MCNVNFIGLILCFRLASWISGSPVFPTASILNARYVPTTSVVVGSDDTDGSAQRFIINGANAIASENPYHGSLQERINTTWVHVCGATLISRKKVLMAAHCLAFWGRRQYRVAFGWQSLSLGELNPNSQIFKIATIRIPPDWDACSTAIMGDDIAFGILQGKVDLSSGAVAPIAVHTGSISELVGQSCVIVGWGINIEDGTQLSDNLQKTNMTITDRDLCIRFWAIDPTVEITEEMVCTLDWPYNLSTVCQGDSGGALVCGNEMVGIVSFSNSVCNGCVPTVHTAVGAYTNLYRGYRGY